MSALGRAVTALRGQAETSLHGNINYFGMGQEKGSDFRISPVRDNSIVGRGSLKQQMVAKKGLLFPKTPFPVHWKGGGRSHLNHPKGLFTCCSEPRTWIFIHHSVLEKL